MSDNGAGAVKGCGFVITIEEFLAFCDRTLTAYAVIVTDLGDARVNGRVPTASGPDSNSAYGLVAHVVGVMGRWGRTVNRGIVVPRDRDAEFTAQGSAHEALALLEFGRARFHEDVLACDPSAAPVNPPAGPERTAYATQGAVLLHVHEELTQHLGQLEIIRDGLRAR